jgi:septin family protein
LGKSTFLKAFLQRLVGAVNLPTHDRSQASVVESFATHIQTETRCLDLHILETPSFGLCVDEAENLEPILKYIEKQATEYMQLEESLDRSLLTLQKQDTRVHCVLFFLSPHWFVSYG